MQNGEIQTAAPGAEPVRLDVVVVGAGFSGLYLLHRLRGLGLSAVALEAGDGVGGTWHWNRYPGARVDIESQEYSFSFSKELEDEWAWSERYSAQPELLDYANHVADRFDLRRDIRLNTRVAEAAFQDSRNRWSIRTDGGDHYDARFCVMATGCLSAVNEPSFEGLSSFQGEVLHTARWPRNGVDFTGRRVGVIGTGSSAIQSIPVMARTAEHLTVFQRTANYSVPAHNGPIDQEVLKAWTQDREEKRRLQRASQAGFLYADSREQSALEADEEERRRIFEERWARGGFTIQGAFGDLALNPEANRIAHDFFAGKIREIIKDPKTAEALIPRGYPFGTKRLCVDIGYYETFNRPNVSLVDVREDPIEAITPAGVRTTRGEHPLDVLVLATGFDAMTGALDRIRITGRGGHSLKQAWAEGPRTYLGLMVAGFPNLFLVTGPGSPSVLSNMIVSIEQHVDWITACIQHLGEHQLGLIEAKPEAQDAWVAHVNEAAAATLFPTGNSWYLGANIPGKPRVFMPYVGGVGVYRDICDGVVARGYEGFAVAPAQDAAA